MRMSRSMTKKSQKEPFDHQEIFAAGLPLQTQFRTLDTSQPANEERITRRQWRS